MTEFDNGTPCRDCGRPMLAQRTWHRKPELRPGHARLNGYDLCNSCYTRARRAGTLPNPAPLRQPRRVVGPRVHIRTAYTVTCSECGEIGQPASRENARRLRLQHSQQSHRESLGVCA